MVLTSAILLQLVFNGIIAGGTYAVAAIGYHMVYGALKFVNFAHGSIAVFGAYIAWSLSVGFLHLALIPSVILAVVLTALLGIFIERVAYRPLRNAPKLAPMVTAMAVSLMLDATTMMVIGSDIKRFDLPVVEGIKLGPVFATPVQLTILVTSVVCMVLIWLLLAKSRLGKAIRAVADNPDLAEASGIDSNIVISATFGIGSALAAVAGILIGMDTSLQPTMGFVIMVKSYAAVVLGGMGNVVGAVIGSFVIGMAENLGVWVIPPIWKDVIAYGILILCLFIRPNGLLGKKEEISATVLGG
jgi:branched-subunit amino acid ABC-type transport system permease component